MWKITSWRLIFEIIKKKKSYQKKTKYTAICVNFFEESSNDKISIDLIQKILLFQGALVKWEEEQSAKKIKSFFFECILNYTL